MQILPLNGTKTVIVGPIVDDTDFKTAETGMAATMSVKVIKSDGYTGIATSDRHSTGTIIHQTSGHYAVPLDSIDLNMLGHMRLVLTNAGALIGSEKFFVVESVVYDAFMGLDTFPIDAENGVMAGQIAAMMDGFDDTNNLFNVNVKRLSDDATAADNMEAAFDGTGYAFPNSVIPANVTQIGGNTSRADRLGDMMTTVIAGQATSGTTAGMNTNLTYANGILQGRWVFFKTGARAGTAVQIATYLNASGAITFANAITGAPANGDLFVII